MPNLSHAQGERAQNQSIEHPIPRLSFRPDGSFVIVQFTDLHLTDGGPADRKTLALLATVLELEQPDLVILTGDIIAGADTPIPDSAKAWRMAVEPIERLGLPWAAVFGNHDDEGDLSRAELMQVQQGFAGCLSQPGPASLPGVGNYVIDLENAQGDARARLYLLDSLSYGPEGVSRYAWISTEQIAWFQQQAEAGKGLTGLMFFHIPLPEYDLVWQQGACIGNKLEKVCCPSVNSGMFDAIRASRAVAGVFVGHDHINDYEGMLAGVRLCYGRAGGHGSYGSKHMPRGARVIRLFEHQAGFETWLRLEDGASVKHVA
jgi:Calcineurin-like phosphoesterase